MNNFDEKESESVSFVQNASLKSRTEPNVPTNSNLQQNLRDMNLNTDPQDPQEIDKTRHILSPFSNSSHLSTIRKDNQVRNSQIKVITSPGILFKGQTHADYVSSTSPTSPGPSELLPSLDTGVTSDLQMTSLHTPILDPSSEKRGQVSGGGQAAEMQARIMALQRSRSKRASSSVSRSSPQLQSIGCRSASSSSIPSIPQGSSSISCISTPDTEDRPHLEKIVDLTSGTSQLESLQTESISDEQSPKDSTNRFDNIPHSSQTVLSQPETQEDRVYRPTLPNLSPDVSPKYVISNGFDPNTVINQSGASFAASGGPISLSRVSSFRAKQLSSLSARRGMKLNGMNSPTLNIPNESTFQTSTNDRVVAQNRSVREPAGLCQGQIPKEKGNRGLFRDYRKYIDIETGTLNFAGKACVHASGIEFSSGDKFSISMDKLQFICELGVGNYGIVQKVLHIPNGVFMAVKEIKLELDEASLRQIIMELDVLHRCEMQNIIAFYGAFFVEGSVYICMEYMNGGSISKIYGDGLPEKYLKYVVRCVVMGLKQLKEQFNIIHRDVKPTNILCSTSGHVKLCDFGVSGNLVASIARTNVGCQAYMAPERIRVDNFDPGSTHQPMTYTAESDIWSLGLSIIEMAKGSYPYPSDSYASIFSQLNAIVEDPSPALNPSKYSSEACDFVNKLLCKEPRHRPKYADIVKHPWLAKVDCTMEEFGRFVKERLSVQQDNSVAIEQEQHTPIS